MLFGILDSNGCCDLTGGLCFVEQTPVTVRSHPNSAIYDQTKFLLGHFLLSLGCCLARLAIAQRLVDFTRHPQTVQ